MFGKSNLNKGIELYNSQDYIQAHIKLNYALQSGDLNRNDIYLAYVTDGCCLFHIGNHDDAIRAHECALQYINSHFLAYRELGRVYAGLKDFETSVQYLREAVKLDYTDFESWFLMAMSLVSIDFENTDETEITLKTALKYSDNQDTEKIDLINQLLYVIGFKEEYKTGIELIENGNYADAINIYNSILERIDSNSAGGFADLLNSIHAGALFKKGICLYEMEKYESAIEALNEMINLTPNDTTPYLNIAECYLRLNLFDEAVKWYEKAENCIDDETEKNYILIRRYARIFNELLVKKDYQTALDEANSITEKNSVFICLKKVYVGIGHYCLENYDEALNNLLPYTDSGWIDSAIGIFFRGEINRYIGATYYKNNDYETALKYLNKSIQLDSEGAIDTWVFMGESYIALGEYEKAIEPLRKAIEAWKPNDDHDLAYLESRLKFAKEKLGYNSTENDDAGSSVCPKCGAKVVSEDTFCRKCGNRLKDND